MNILEQLNAKGYVEIYKHHLDGRVELVYKDPNTITNGMAVTLARAFTAPNQPPLADFQIRYFQLGKGAGTDGSSTKVLTTPLTAAEYTTDGNADLVYRSVYNAGANRVQTFVRIPNSQIARSGADKVTYILTLDTNTANGMAITELGLFSENPIAINASPMCAYKTITSITKTSGFALTNKWSIEF